jgi:hypothetical protein
MITLNSLNSLSAKDLGEQAKKLGVPGWRAMKKEELIKVLLKHAKRGEKDKSRIATAKSVRTSTGLHGPRNQNRARGNARLSTPSGASKSNEANSSGAVRPGKAEPARPTSAIAEGLRAERERHENLKNLSMISTLDREQKAPKDDRLVLVVRDAYWVQAYWEITKRTVERAKVALESQWHSARPVLRLLEIQSEGNTNSIESVVEQIPIHGGVKNWFIHLKQPGKSYRVAIGYVADDDRFYLICKSNQICPPAANTGQADNCWTDLTNEVEKYFALSGGYDETIQSGELQAVFEEKSRHPIHAPAFEKLGSGINGHSSEFMFHVDAHMIVYGKAIPNGSVMIGGEPVRLQKDGTFSVKVDLPDRRQVLPIIASSRDGTQQRTTVLAIERNTKIMEPLTNDCDD